MIPVALGLPVAGLRCLLQSAAARLTESGLRTAFLEADNLSALAAHATETPASHTILMLTYVNQDWSKILAEMDVPFIHAHSDPLANIATFEDKLAGTRATMMRLSSFVEPQANSHCETIDTTRPGSEADILRFLARRLDIPHSTFDGLLENLPQRAFGAEAALASQNELEISIHGALKGFEGLKSGVRPQSVTVARQFFVDATRDGLPILGPIDATGRPRLLFYGPYVYLPRGVWRARIVVSFTEQLVGYSFGMEAVAELGTKMLVQANFDIEVAGRREMAIEFKHDDPTAPVEVRFFSQRGIFDGMFSLGYAEFTIAHPDNEPISIPQVD